MRLLIAILTVVAGFLATGVLHAQKATARAELTDAAGDVNEFNDRGNSYDVVKLVIDSDGKDLIGTVTLAAEQQR